MLHMALMRLFTEMSINPSEGVLNVLDALYEINHI